MFCIFQNRNANGITISRMEEIEELGSDKWCRKYDGCYWTKRSIFQKVSERLIEHFNQTLQKKSHILLLLFVYHVLFSAFHLLLYKSLYLLHSCQWIFGSSNLFFSFRSLVLQSQHLRIRVRLTLTLFSLCLQFKAYLWMARNILLMNQLLFSNMFCKRFLMVSKFFSKSLQAPKAVKNGKNVLFLKMLKK